MPNPLMIDIPQQIESERLLLCAPEAGFGEIVNQSITHSLETLRPWMAWAQSAPSVEETEANIRQAVIRFHNRESLRFLLFQKHDGVFVGAVGLHPIDWQVASFRIGYWLDTRFAGRGYATEAVKRLVRFAVETLKARRLEIHVDVKNQRSIAVAERACFIYEGTRHRDSLDVHGKLTDTVVYVKFDATF